VDVTILGVLVASEGEVQHHHVQVALDRSGTLANGYNHQVMLNQFIDT
jgi:hypothetical protein